MGRTIWIEDLHNGMYAISAECHDGILYSAGDYSEAIKKYEEDRQCNVTFFHPVNFEGDNRQLNLTDRFGM